MSKSDRWLNFTVAGLLFILALLPFLFLRPPSVPRAPSPSQVEAPYVIITVDGREYTRQSLSQPSTLVIRQEGGQENIVSVTENGAEMLRSTCDNQLCVHMGRVGPDNWEWRPNGAYIICLPNRVSIELVVTP